MAMPAAEAATFSLEYAQHSGYGRMPLRILVEGNQATLIRQETLTAGQPIGLFRATVTAADQKRLASAVPDSIESGTPLQRDSDYFIVRLKTAQRNVELRFAHDPVALGKAAPMMKELERLEKDLAWKPLRAILVELTPAYAVSIRNIGSEPVKVPFGTLGLTIESIAAAEPPKVPGKTPPPRVWEMANGTANLPKSIELAAGQSLEFTLPLGPTAKDKLYRACFNAQGNIDPADPEIIGTAYSLAVPGGHK
ncbi:hypothetical protein [Paludibaculum fermentans]|uniref:hypothetical protein n=1 Tax=Paludibaculum fermentans TaxID=1473598 RepID=UPI003EC06DD2